MLVSLVFFSDEIREVMDSLLSGKVCRSKGYMNFEEYGDGFYEAEKFLYDKLVEKVGESPTGANIPFEGLIDNGEEEFAAAGQVYVQLLVDIDEDKVLYYKDSDTWMCALAGVPYFEDDKDEEYYLELDQSEQEEYKYDSWNNVFADVEECDVARFWEFRLEDVVGFAIRVGPEEREEEEEEDEEE